MYHLLTVLGVTFGVVVLVWSFFKIIRRKPPRYVLPLVAGATALFYSIWDEYTWYDRTVAKLPGHIQVVESFETTGFWQPWTYYKPRINRFLALDKAQTRRNEKLPGLVMTEVILVKKLEATRIVNQLVDCRKAQFMDIAVSTSFDPDGRPTNPEWRAIEPDNSLFLAACATK
ncbi:hypothetical protein [Magnetospira sp. QH-2]|uniref:hypothetical protein n=1 Tax=Magnetospira sp. (strain QH-2) TaxID=1288970 RepID=UPI0003E80FE4|nr:hypothetical protein [Magnetospira sp. QH-2]CCQ72683.1 Conserved protein of unknown function [Magnetospira sp. QH-2]